MSVRIIELDQAYTLQDGDFVGIDSSSEGTRKFDANKFTTNGMVASEYNTTIYYKVGDFVMHDNQLYRCRVATHGTWDGDYWQVSTVAEALGTKQDKVEGKGLSENDFTNALFDKLNSIAAGAQVNVIEQVKVDGSALPIDSKAVDIVGKANAIIVAQAYSTSTSYVIGDYTIYNNLLYKCIGNTSGTWNSAKWSQVNVGGEIKAVYATIDELRAMVGTPLVATNTSQMTDHTKIYVYTGSQAGYTYGHWYYWDGSAWADGGVYNSGAVDNAMSTSSTNAVQNKVITAYVTARVNLYSDVVPNTSQTLTIDSNGTITQILHKSGGTTIRTDVFTYTPTTATEVRTLNTGETLTITTDLSTYATTTTYVGA